MSDKKKKTKPDEDLDFEKAYESVLVDLKYDGIRLDRWQEMNLEQLDPELDIEITEYIRIRDAADTLSCFIGSDSKAIETEIETRTARITNQMMRHSRSGQLNRLKDFESTHNEKRKETDMAIQKIIEIDPKDMKDIMECTQFDNVHLSKWQEMGLNTLDPGLSLQIEQFYLVREAVNTIIRLTDRVRSEFDPDVSELATQIAISMKQHRDKGTLRIILDMRDSVQEKIRTGLTG